VKILKKCFTVTVVILSFVCFTTALWAGQKYSFKSEEALQKLSLGKLVQTCSGLKVISSSSSSESEPIRLYDLPRKRCHYVDRDGPGGNPPVCVEGAGYFQCPCEDVDLPIPQ
jgi:hypothetical protein